MTFDLFIDEHYFQNLNKELMKFTDWENNHIYCKPNFKLKNDSQISNWSSFSIWMYLRITFNLDYIFWLKFSTSLTWCFLIELIQFWTYKYCLTLASSHSTNTECHLILYTLTLSESHMFFGVQISRFESENRIWQ